MYKALYYLFHIKCSLKSKGTYYGGLECCNKNIKIFNVLIINLNTKNYYCYN